MDHQISDIRAANWKKLVNNAISSGKEIRIWCRENNISERQFYYWQRKLRLEEAQKLMPNTDTSLPAARPESNTEAIKPNFIDVTPDANCCKSQFQASSAYTYFKLAAKVRVGKYTLLVADGASQETITNLLRAAEDA